MKKTQCIYILTSVAFFLVGLSLTKISGVNGVDAKDKLAKNQTEMQEESIRETEELSFYQADVSEMEAESNLNMTDEVESESNGEPIIDNRSVLIDNIDKTKFEIVSIGDRIYQFAKSEDGKYEDGRDINYSDLIDFSADYPYYIKVNRAFNTVTIYGRDFDGDYSVPYKTMTCSTGLYKGNTPLGEYEISDKYDWRIMIDDSYAQYASRFNGGVMFHSVPYFSPDNGDLEWEEYNKLGQAASLGCVRLRVIDAKWIYDNCPEGTCVEVYDDEDNPGPLGKELLEIIPEDSECKGWDPTDPNEDNLWNHQDDNKDKKAKKSKKKKRKKHKSKETVVETESVFETESVSETYWGME